MERVWDIVDKIGGLDQDLTAPVSPTNRGRRTASSLAKVGILLGGALCATTGDLYCVGPTDTTAVVSVVSTISRPARRSSVESRINAERGDPDFQAGRTPKQLAEIFQALFKPVDEELEVSDFSIFG